MITLTICNHKGGTGKTTTSMNLAAAFGMTGRDVLVVDLDPQAFLTRMMGESEAAPNQSSLVVEGFVVPGNNQRKEFGSYCMQLLDKLETTHPWK